MANPGCSHPARSGSHTRTRSPCYWARLRRHPSFSSRNATGAVTKDTDVHTNTHTEHICTHITVYHPLYRQLCKTTGTLFPRWRFNAKSSFRGSHLARGTFPTINPQRNLQRWLPKLKDSQYIDLFLCERPVLIMDLVSASCKCLVSKTKQPPAQILSHIPVPHCPLKTRMKRECRM